MRCRCRYLTPHFVLAAVKYEGLALGYASPELQNDKDVVLAAFKQSKEAFRYIGEELQKDEKFIAELIALL